MERVLHWVLSLAVASAGCVVVDDPHDYRAVYEPCESDGQCPGWNDCWTVEIDYGDAIVGDSMCTQECNSDFDCDLDGACIDAAGGPPLCYARCFDDLDCYEGFACVETVGDHHYDPVCMPW